MTKIGFPLYDNQSATGRIVFFCDTELKIVDNNHFYIPYNNNYKPFCRVTDRISQWYKIFLIFKGPKESEKITPDKLGKHFQVFHSTDTTNDFIGDSHTLSMIFFAIYKTLGYFGIKTNKYNNIILTGQYPDHQVNWKGVGAIDCPIEKYEILESYLTGCSKSKEKNLYVYVPPTDNDFIEDKDGKNEKIKKGNETIGLEVLEIKNAQSGDGLETILKKVYGDDIISRIEYEIIEKSPIKLFFARLKIFLLKIWWKILLILSVVFLFWNVYEYKNIPTLSSVQAIEKDVVVGNITQKQVTILSDNLPSSDDYQINPIENGTTKPIENKTFISDLNVGDAFTLKVCKKNWFNFPCKETEEIKILHAPTFEITSPANSTTLSGTYTNVTNIPFAICVFKKEDNNFIMNGVAVMNTNSHTWRLENLPCPNGTCVYKIVMVVPEKVPQLNATVTNLDAIKCPGTEIQERRVTVRTQGQGEYNNGRQNGVRCRTTNENCISNCRNLNRVITFNQLCVNQGYCLFYTDSNNQEHYFTITENSMYIPANATFIWGGECNDNN